MKSMTIRYTSVLFFAAVAFQAPAHAYIDPGTGSIILQTILGGVAGGAFVLKLYWRRLVNFTRRKSLPAAKPPASNR